MAFCILNNEYSYVFLYHNTYLHSNSFVVWMIYKPSGESSW